MNRLALSGLVAILAACGNQAPCPYYHPGCDDRASSSPTSPDAPTSAIRVPERLAAVTEAPSGVEWTASTGAIRRFLGTDSFKIVLGTGKRLYLLLPADDSSSLPRVLRLDKGDEGPSATAGWPNEPLLSPDGHWVAFAGDFNPQSQTASFVREAVPGTGWRIPAVRAGGKVTNPHWHMENGALWLYATDVAGVSAWDASSRKVGGATFRAQFRDTVVAAFETATVNGAVVPGSFKGGISLDGKWVGTSYQTSVLFETSTSNALILNGGEQQCNPSMNPFRSGSNTDFMMVLGFGGDRPVPTPAGNVFEAQHEHLWIWTKEDKAVWQGALPNKAPHPSNEVPGQEYSEWQRPEWSTHPDFATALAKRTGTTPGTGYDFFIVKLGENGGELAAHDRSTLLERGPVLRLATGNISSSDWSHLWVKN